MGVSPTVTSRRVLPSHAQKLAFVQGKPRSRAEAGRGERASILLTPRSRTPAAPWQPPAPRRPGLVQRARVGPERSGEARTARGGPEGGAGGRRAGPARPPPHPHPHPGPRSRRFVRPSVRPSSLGPALAAPRPLRPSPPPTPTASLGRRSPGGIRHVPHEERGVGGPRVARHDLPPLPGRSRRRRARSLVRSFVRSFAPRRRCLRSAGPTTRRDATRRDATLPARPPRPSAGTQRAAADRTPRGAARGERAVGGAEGRG